MIDIPFEIGAEKLHEKCAVTAAVMNDGEQVSALLNFMMLYALQHRGVEASGIASQTPSGNLKIHREPAFVKDAFDEETLESLRSDVAIGHNRYSTNGSKFAHMQPVDDRNIGYAMATNGNLPVTDYLETFLKKNNVRTDEMNDSELKAHAIAQHIRNGHDLPDAIELAHPLFRGAYSSVAMHDGMVVAFRDPKGIRPLELGTIDGGYVVASETCALDMLGATAIRSVKPGEMVTITSQGIETKQFAEGSEKLDIFEFVYFARPDSYLYGENVAMVRRRLGEQLAEEHPHLAENPNAVIIPVPETAVPIAEGLAERLDLPVINSAIVKNRYVGRTFMLQTQALRQRFLDIKHSLIPEFIKGKDVYLPDDSIVRLNTARAIVQKTLAAGAKSVTFLSASPPIRFPDYYGIDTPSQKELAAANMTVEQMRQEIYAEYLGFLSLSRMIAATNQPPERFNLSAFNGVYPIGIGNHKSEICQPEDMSYVDLDLAS
ncbi:amidophosphoribosyltransferase [Candidatus Saccharibacteria bacterium]|nr:amidophosphoribosyltransferase [Candidatus Saccharibacteria bacterium]